MKRYGNGIATVSRQYRTKEKETETEKETREREKDRYPRTRRRRKSETARTKSMLPKPPAAFDTVVGLIKAESGTPSSEASLASIAASLARIADALAPAPESYRPCPDAAMTIADRIDLRLRATGKSAASASLEAGLGRSAIQSILSGASKSLRVDTIQRLATVLQCEPLDLIGRSFCGGEDT